MGGDDNGGVDCMKKQKSLKAWAVASKRGKILSWYNDESVGLAIIRSKVAAEHENKNFFKDSDSEVRRVKIVFDD